MNLRRFFRDAKREASLVREIEYLHKCISNDKAEIVRLRGEVSAHWKIITTLKDLLNERRPPPRVGKAPRIEVASEAEPLVVPQRVGIAPPNGAPEAVPASTVHQRRLVPPGHDP